MKKSIGTFAHFLLFPFDKEDINIQIANTACPLCPMILDTYLS